MCHGPTQFNGHLALCFPDEPLCERSRGVLLNEKTLPCQPNPTGTCQMHLCMHRENHSITAKLQLTWPGNQVSPSAQPQVTSQALQWGSCRSQLVHSLSPPGLPLYTGTAGCKGHCKVPLADLMNMSPVALQPLSPISSKGNTRMVMKHGGKPATLKPRAAKGHVNKGWQTPACGWFENQFLIAATDMTTIVSQTKILRSCARKLLSLKNYNWRFSALLSSTWPTGLKRNKEDLLKDGKIHPSLLNLFTHLYKQPLKLDYVKKVVCKGW